MRRGGGDHREFEIAAGHGDDDHAQSTTRQRPHVMVVHQDRELDQPRTTDKGVGVLMVVDNNADGAVLLRALRTGATGIVSLEDDLSGLPGACRMVAGGDTYVSPSLIDGLVRHLVGGRLESHARFGLTPRESQVLRCLTDGLSSSEIAVKLRLRPRTAKHHLSSVYRKLGVPDAPRAIVRAYKEGLVA